MQAGPSEAKVSVRYLAGAPRPPANPYDADVIILALDRAKETCAAIDSALAQLGVTRHVTVLDQGSCPAALVRIIAHVGNRPNVTLLRAERNLGVAGGRNHATAIGHGRVIAALDNDAEFGDRRLLARAVAALDDDPAIGVVGCRIVAHGSGADDLSSWGYPSRLLGRAGDSFDTATFVGAGHVIRRAAWDAAGGYDAALFFCWEEFDFALRVIGAGWRIHYRGDLVVRHKVSGERRVGWSDIRWFQHVRNRLYIGHKYGASWLALAPRIAGYLVKGLRSGLLTETLRAIAAAVRLGWSTPVRALSAEAVAYLRRTDTEQRGPWRYRLRHEVLALVPRTAIGTLVGTDAAPSFNYVAAWKVQPHEMRPPSVAPAERVREVPVGVE